MTAGHKSAVIVLILNMGVNHHMLYKTLKSLARKIKYFLVYPEHDMIDRYLSQSVDHIDLHYRIKQLKNKGIL